ncbi:MAG: 4-demethylwyosine synthase TYW1 [Asgard group archaeon]|nr:4-demethylwyosine synthase TYW1 [Asgard group archaeon]
MAKTIANCIYSCSDFMVDNKIHPDSIIPKEIQERLLKQGYQLYGKQVAVKKCLWTHNYLKENRFCYKNAYGIKSHQCIQATPTLLCNHQCVFCWRLQEKDIGLKPFWKANPEDFDTPEEVYKGLLWGWKRCISGYKPIITQEKFVEATKPRHVALSLAGEPTLYPFMTELLRLLKKKGLTTFIVSNGTIPETLQKMIDEDSIPTQLYITIPAPDKKEYIRVCKPLISNGWDKIQESLKILSTFPGRTVTRLTLAKKINMINPEEYVPLIQIAQPSFVEIKGFAPVGFSQYRVTRANMPYIEDIQAFADKLKTALPKYKQVYEMEESKVVILSNGKQPLKIPNLN